MNTGIVAAALVVGLVILALAVGALADHWRRQDERDARMFRQMLRDVNAIERANKIARKESSR